MPTVLPVRWRSASASLTTSGDTMPSTRLGKQEDGRRVDDDPRQQRQTECLADDEIGDDQDQQAGDAAGDEDDAERAPRRVPVGDDAAEVVADRHAGEHDADDAGPRVERDADVRSHDAAGDEFDDERARTADEDERTGLPHEPHTSTRTLVNSR